MKKTVRFGPGASSDAPKSSPPPVRRYPFRLADDNNVHPLFARLKVRSEASELFGIESVILEFLNCLASYVNDCAEKPDAGSFRDQLLLDLQPQLSFLSENGVRRFHLALGNVIRQFKKLLHSLPAQASSAEVRQQCKEWLEDFYKANFMKATEAIVNFTTEKVNGLAATNLVTYGWSPVVERILLVLSECPQQKEVSVLDSAPGGKALNLAKALALRGVQTVYGQLDAVGEVMRHAHIVLLGGSAVLSNGSVLAPRGAGLIALAAHTRNVPVLVTVKSYQFVDKVRTLEKHSGSALDSEPLELVPADLITALVTEIRILPPTSAPAVLKAKQLLST